MSTESPTSLELVTATLLRMQKTISHILDINPQSYSIVHCRLRRNYSHSNTTLLSAI
jgi:hypothetical protein